uniref:ASPSCR1 tether for SLC2A4, UBX domain containing n=1 Tax=Crocodylus porosus TaxID=8502 RepID=A0A7M4FUC8_CROPO
MVPVSCQRAEAENTESQSLPSGLCFFSLWAVPMKHENYLEGSLLQLHEHPLMVRIALQLDDGSRLQDIFHSSQTLWDLLQHFTQSREFVERPRDSFPVCIYMRDEIAGRDALEKTTLKLLGLTGGSAIIRVVMKKHSSSGQEEAVDTAAQANEPPQRSVCTEGAVDLSLLQTNTFPKDLDHRDVSASLKSCTDEQPDALASSGGLQAATAPVPFVPFSGGGQCLGESPAAAAVPVSDMPSSKLPVSLCSPGGPSKPKKTKTSQGQPKEHEQLLEREPVVCHLDLQPELPPSPKDFPDEFFEVTVDDVRKRLSQLQSERKRLEETPLMTKSMRETQMKEKLERYPKVVLRVHFPDRHVLQGFFRPSETVGDLRGFVRGHLADAELPFYLFITPPRTILSDESLTLFEAKLFPAALVHFGSEERRDYFLRPDLLESAVSPSAADLLVARCLSKSLVPSAPSASVAASPLPAGLEETANERGATEHPEPAEASVAPQPVRRAPGKVPKWLKLPGGKR